MIFSTPSKTKHNQTRQPKEHKLCLVRKVSSCFPTPLAQALDFQKLF